MFDTGSSTGDIIGHSKTVNAVSIRRQRPFRAATASDDTTIAFHHGKDNSPSSPEPDLRLNRSRCTIQVCFSESYSNIKLARLGSYNRLH
jgi:hypothetical protein